MDVFGLGQCSLDYVGRIPAWPSPDTKCEFHDMVIQGGGPVATALVALSRWGLACHFAGVAGDDPFGKQIARFLQDEGVDTSGLVERPGHRSQFAFIASEPGGRRTIFWQRPTGEALKPSEIRMDILRASRVLHTDGLFIEASLAAASEAKKAGVIVAVDAGTLREGMLELARLSDCFVSSESFARSLVGGDDPLGACRRIARARPEDSGRDPGCEGICGPVRRAIHREARLCRRGRRHDGLRRCLPRRPHLWTRPGLGPREKLRSCRLGRGAGGNPDGRPGGDPAEKRAAGQGVRVRACIRDRPAVKTPASACPD